MNLMKDDLRKHLISLQPKRYFKAYYLYSTHQISCCYNVNYICSVFTIILSDQSIEPFLVHGCYKFKLYRFLNFIKKHLI